MDNKINNTTHSFSVSLAEQIGLNETIILGHLYHWCIGNSDNKDMIKDGYIWVYLSRKKMCSIYPYFTENIIKYTINKLFEKEYIKIANYNKLAIDKTNWYALTDKAYNLYGTSISKLTNVGEKRISIGEKCTSNSENNQAIQDIEINYNNKDNKEDTSVSKKDESFNFKQELLKLGVSEDVATDWMKIRKKAANSERAFNHIKHEIELTGASANDCITLCADKGWLGFEAEWFFKIKGKSMSAYDVNKEKDNANKILINGVEYK